MYEVVALGELLIDFTPAGISENGGVLFERNPGGAPANVLTAISKLGANCAFIGKVGNDQFGHYLKSVLENNNIETNGLKFSDSVNTTLAFVHLDSKGDRSFSFYRKPGADIMLDENDLNYSLIDNSTIFHFGSLSMTAEPARNATIKAVTYAKQKGRIISYDPNWRPPLWESNEHARTNMSIGFEYADILKVSEQELQLLTGTDDLEKGSKLLSNKGAGIVLVTLGPKGCYFRCKAGIGHLNTYDTKVIDTTGAGDAFLGAFLYKICRSDLSKSTEKLGDISLQSLIEFVDFSNAAGALCASRKGAIPAMPSFEEIMDCRSKNKLINYMFSGS